MNDYSSYLSPMGRRLHESAIRRMGTVVARQADVVSFAPGYPDSGSFPWEELREITQRLLSGADHEVLQYGPTGGYAPLVEAIVPILGARGIAATRDEVLITTGSQQGLDLIARLFVTPGDVVLVELPAYTGAIAAFGNAQAELVGVRQEADGVSLEHLDDVCQRHRAAGRRVHLLYLVPNFQNPTGLLLSLEKRRRLLEWAERRDMLIVEDDPYGSLYFDDMTRVEETRSIRADDRSGRVIYLSSFSKTLVPGLRVGWVVAPSTLIERLETAKQSVDLMSGSLDQRIVCEAISGGAIERLAPRLRELYRLKRDVMETALRAEAGDLLSWTQPRGGFFLWASLPAGHDDLGLLTKALEQRLVFVVGSAFFVDGAGHDRIRLSFSAPAPERIQEGARRLGAALRQPVATEYSSR